MKLEGKEGTGMVQSTTRSGCTACHVCMDLRLSHFYYWSSKKVPK